MNFIGLLRTLEQISRPPRLGHDVDAPLTAQCFDEYDDYPGHRGVEGEPHYCTRAVRHDGDHECGVCEVVWERACRSPADCAAYDCQGDCDESVVVFGQRESTDEKRPPRRDAVEPGLTPDELVGVRGLLQERYGEACTCPSWGNPSWPHRHDCPANPSARVNQSPGACAEPTAPADLPAAGSGPSEVSGNPPPPSEGRPTSELLIKAAHVICDLRSGHPSAAATRQLVADLNARAAIFADIEQDK